MSSESRVPLSSVAELISIKVPVSALVGHPYVSTENLLPNLGGTVQGELPCSERVNSFHKFDTLFSNIRPYFRKVHYARTGGGCSADVLVFRTRKPKEFLPAFLYYCLADPTFIEHTMATCKGAKMPRGDKGAMVQYKIFKPDLASQKRISDLLRSIDDSIEAFQHQNTALESIAQTLFRSWFVDFDPVHAKAADNAPEAMSAELAALFPSELEDSEQGLIPKGWRSGRLSDICSLNPESWSAKTHPAVVKYVDLSGLKENVFSEPVEYAFSEAPSRARRVLRKGDSLYGTVRPGNLSFGFVGWNETGLTGSTGFAVLRPTEKNSTEFIYCAMTLKENIERLTHLAEGAAYPAVRPDIVHEQPAVVPSSEVMQAFHVTTASLFSLHAHNCRLIFCLASLRDHLLPRLISGKLCFEEAEASVAAITSEVEAELA